MQENKSECFFLNTGVVRFDCFGTDMRDCWYDFKLFKMFV